MNVFDSCPRCHSIAIKVPRTTVDHHTGGGVKLGSGEWFACCSSTCDMAFFSSESLLLLKDINTKIWFKDQGLDVPICYCYNITRREIYEAVDEGCKDIKEVRHYLNKNITGECELMNPIGGCCHKAFLREISHHSEI